MTASPLTDLQEIELREERRMLQSFADSLQRGDLPISEDHRLDALERTLRDIARIDRELGA